MSLAPAPAEDTVPFDRGLFWRVIAMVLTLLVAVGALLWMRFGSLIFFDMLASLQGCF